MNDEIERLAGSYRDKFRAANERADMLKQRLDGALNELYEARSMVRWIKRKNETLQKSVDRQTNRAAWYRAKLLKFVTTKWIAEERKKDGRN